jgi:hypothetical protein
VHNCAHIDREMDVISSAMKFRFGIDYISWSNRLRRDLLYQFHLLFIVSIKIQE